jgi:hypothetical protein
MSCGRCAAGCPWSGCLGTTGRFHPGSHQEHVPETQGRLPPPLPLLLVLEQGEHRAAVGLPLPLEPESPLLPLLLQGGRGSAAVGAPLPLVPELWTPFQHDLLPDTSDCTSVVLTSSHPS